MNDMVANAVPEGTPEGAAGGIYWQRFTVPYDYPVAFTRGIFRPSNALLADVLARAEPHKRHRALVFLDAGLLAARPGLPGEIATWCEAHADRVALAAEPIALPGGEAVKRDPAHLDAVHEAVERHGIDRHAFVIAMGGGAILDAVGLGAATAHRGVRHVRLPSTVLAQNDSGVGVKNAVNRGGSKNFMGSFAPPWGVVNDLDLLAGLPARARIEGVSEAVKVALIRDRAFFEWIEASAERLLAFEPPAEERMIRRCAELHMRQIAQGGDPFESGSARPLDFGHWAAHKLESLTDHAVTHAAAVAIGIALDTRYSVLAGHLAPGGDARVARLLHRLGFALYHPALERPGPDGRPALLAGLEEFREHLGGELTVTLLEDLGRGLEVHAIDPALVGEALAWLRALEAAR